jgi:chromosome segregation ATPase
MSNFWCNFLPVIIGVGSAILGGLIGWFMRRPRIEELSEVIETQEANYLRLKNAHDTLAVRNNSLQDSYNSMFSIHQKMEQDYGSLESKISYWQLQYNNYKRDADTYKADAEDKIADLQNQLSEWHDEYNTLYDKYDVSNRRIAELESTEKEYPFVEHTHLNGQYTSLVKELDEHKQDKDSLSEQVNTWRNAYESLRTSNESLNNRIAALESELAESKTIVIKKESDILPNFQDLQERYNELETRLNGMSRRYQDITTEKEKYDSIIASLNAELTTYRNRYTPDDLKVIEGIGPKIEEILNKAGIIKFSQLSDMEPAQVKTILEVAGSRFSMHNPETWGIQADLANKGDWDKLKEYQEYLSAGRDTKATAGS